MSGPLETERQAMGLPAVRAVYAAFDAEPGMGKMAPHNLAMLLDACADAGIAVGAYDSRILHWLAGWEPATCAVIAGLITRAGNAGGMLMSTGDEGTVLDALAVAAEYRRYRASLTCETCAAHPAELCEDHQADLDAAEAYDDLAGRMGGGR